MYKFSVLRLIFSTLNRTSFQKFVKQLNKLQSIIPLHLKTLLRVKKKE